MMIISLALFVTMPIDNFECNYSSREHDKLYIFQVPSLYGKQGAQLISVALLVVARTWISDRIAYLNGEFEPYIGVFMHVRNMLVRS